MGLKIPLSLTPNIQMGKAANAFFSDKLQEQSYCLSMVYKKRMLPVGSIRFLSEKIMN